MDDHADAGDDGHDDDEDDDDDDDDGGGDRGSDDVDQPGLTSCTSPPGHSHFAGD